jgi:hypothetical protein
MERSPTPRQMAKQLLSGIMPARPLFLPLVFSLGAKVENMPLGAYLGNPTKICSALRQMQKHLRSDGVACYFDPYLEVEALGADLQRISEDQAPTIRWPHRGLVGELPEEIRLPEEAAKGGRIPVAVEVIRRMNALPNREFLLMAGVTGPLTLAARITQMEHSATLRAGDLSEAALELAANVATQMATTFLEAGADTIIIHEEVVPAHTSEACAPWVNLLAPTINVVRFYEALPVLNICCSHLPNENWEVIYGQPWDCINCLAAEVIASREKRGLARTSGIPHGIALPLDAFRPEGSDDGTPSPDIQKWMSDCQPSIVTTAGDVPFTTDMKHLIKGLEGVPRAV